MKETERRLRDSEAQLTTEAAALLRLNAASARLWNTQDLGQGLEEMLAATIELLGADKGTVQLLDPRTGRSDYCVPKRIQPGLSRVLS